jgi:hypothetical protein
MEIIGNVSAQILNSYLVISSVLSIIGSNKSFASGKLKHANVIKTHYLVLKLLASSEFNIGQVNDITLNEPSLLYLLDYSKIKATINQFNYLMLKKKTKDKDVMIELKSLAYKKENLLRFNRMQIFILTLRAQQKNIIASLTLFGFVIKQFTCNLKTTAKPPKKTYAAGYQAGRVIASYIRLSGIKRIIIKKSNTSPKVKALLKGLVAKGRKKKKKNQEVT